MDKIRRANLLNNTDLMQKAKDYNALHFNMIEGYKSEPNYIIREFSFQDWDTALKYYMNLSGSDREDFDDALRILRSNGQKRWRLKKVVEEWFNNHENVFFCTFTLDDNHIDHLLDTNRKLLTSSINDFCNDYICNVDYGSKTDRLHFHGLLCLKDYSVLTDQKIIDNKKWYTFKNWSGGFSSAVKVSHSDSLIIKNYIVKLMYHATKESTKYSNIIRMRKRLPIYKK